MNHIENTGSQTVVHKDVLPRAAQEAKSTISKASQALGKLVQSLSLPLANKEVNAISQSVERKIHAVTDHVLNAISFAERRQDVVEDIFGIFFPLIDNFDELNSLAARILGSPKSDIYSFWSNDPMRGSFGLGDFLAESYARHQVADKKWYKSEPFGIAFAESFKETQPHHDTLLELLNDSHKSVLDTCPLPSGLTVGRISKALEKTLTSIDHNQGNTSFLLSLLMESPVTQALVTTQGGKTFLKQPIELDSLQKAITYAIPRIFNRQTLTLYRLECQGLSNDQKTSFLLGVVLSGILNIPPAVAGYRELFDFDDLFISSPPKPNANEPNTSVYPTPDEPRFRQTPPSSTDNLLYHEKYSPNRTLAEKMPYSVFFANKVADMSHRLGIDPDSMMACISFETGGTFSPQKTNPYGAVGLIQFTHTGISIFKNAFFDSYGRRSFIDRNVTLDDLRKMKADKQLHYVEAYLSYRIHTKGPPKNERDVYLYILAPAGVGKDDDHVLRDKNSKSSKNRKRYRANSGLDKKDPTTKKGDGQITVAEVTHLFTPHRKKYFIDNTPVEKKVK